MTSAASKAIAVQNALTQVLRDDRGRLMAGLISRLGDFGRAEDALQEASIAALKHWGRSGIPASPIGWLMKVALNKGIDRIRQSQREDHKAQEVSHLMAEHDAIDTAEDIPDERLRLIFTCCHPALEEKSRIALTLRTVCQLTTSEIANAFLDTEATMGQRLSRSKAKIKSAGIGFKVPDPEDWAERLETVLATLYLIFTTGYVTQEVGERDLCAEGLFLVRLLDRLRAGDPEIQGALALMLLTDARRPARIGADGASVAIEDQDRSLWQGELIAEGQRVLMGAVDQRAPGPFQIKAAIADCHMGEGGPDWAQISLLYQSLWAFEPTPVVALNWAVVLSELGHTETALTKIDSLSGALSQFQPFHAARADVLRKLDRGAEAASAYATAIEMAPNDAARIFLQNRLAQIQITKGL